MNAAKDGSAPIALFAYNREAHLRKTIEALRENAEAPSSPLHIFSDAPKHSSDRLAVEAVRAYIKTIVGFSSVRVTERTENYGLARSIIDGVTQVCSSYGRIIVLEDDMVVSKYFLRYMNEALNAYEHDDRVVSIHAYAYPIAGHLPDTMFLNAAHCWGWATWVRGWSLFEADGRRLLSELRRRNLTKQFDFDGTFPYTKMLQDQIKGRNDSWAIRWYASTFLQDKLTLYPGRSLLYNTGMDGSGTHSSATDRYFTKVADHPILVADIAVVENVVLKKAMSAYFARTHPSLPVRVAGRLLRKIKGGR